MNKYDNVVILIPSLEPKYNFVDIIKELHKEFNNIFVVNDGSGAAYDPIFQEIEQMGIEVFKHNINMGKGRALKDAFNILLNDKKYHTDEKGGIITADSDGQHILKDIIKCADALLEKDALVLGCRDFDEDTVPLKSKFGNKITRQVFSIFVGLNITDTQTGLRGISWKHVTQFLKTKGERFEYETNMLLDTSKYQIDICEVPIETVYIADNESSHFNPLLDSFQIYKLFLKYIVSSLSSFALDIVLFTIFLSLFNLMNMNFYPIFAATVSARIISSLYNYIVNSKLVFDKINSKSSLLKYYILVVIQMIISGTMVSLGESVLGFISPVILKIFVDTIIFIINFYVQREWVFKEDE